MGNDSIDKDKAVPTRSKSGKIKRLLFWCFMVIIPLVIMELFSFTYIQLTSKKGTYRDRMNHVDNPYHPYLGYVHAPNSTYEITKAISKPTSLKTNENGYSITPSFSYENPDMTIVVTGGSTIFGVGSSDNSSTVPSILERLINQRLSIRIEVINLALRGAQSFQEMLLVDRFFAEKKADLVLAISGRNDANQAFAEPTVEGTFLKKQIWDNAVSLVHRAERGEFMLINIEHRLRLWSYTFDLLYRKITSRSGKAPLAAASKLNLRREASLTIKNRAKITSTHFSAADQISKMNGATFVMFLQPTLYTKNYWTDQEFRRMKSKNWSDEIIQKHRDNEREFYNAFRETEKPFQFIDLADIFSNSNETLYIDYCHYNDVAAEKFAEKIFDSIQPILHTIGRG